MEDYLLIELLKKSKSDPSFSRKLTELMEDKHYGTHVDGGHRMMEHSRGYDDHLFNKFVNTDSDWHYDEKHAKYIVDNMYHYDTNDKMESGEHFSMIKAKAVCDTYKKMHHLDITPEDVYVAINAQYHDYSKLYKSWFGSNIDNKIIESAMCFWFKDVDYDKGSKVWNYFQES